MGSKKPFERVVAEHGQTVLRVCLAVVGADDADDAWSETFLSAMRAYPALPEDANIEAWLVRIAHRKAIDIIRVQQRAAMPVAEVPDRPSAIGISAAADTEVWDVVKSLPDKQRQAIAYHFLAGLPYVEIAQILGGTTDAARRAAADGMKSLRKAFLEPDSKGAST